MSHLSVVQGRARLPARPSPFGGRTIAILAMLAVVAWAISQLGLFQHDLINEGGWTIALRFLRASIHPELGPDFLKLTADATLVTLAYAVCGAALSVLLGSVGGLLGSEAWWRALLHNRRAGPLGLGQHRAPWLVVRGMLALPRAIHEVVWGLFFINVLGLNPLTAVMAIAIPFGAVTAKVFSEILDETPRQPLLALQASGVPPLKAFLYTLVPQALPNLLSYIFYRFECSIRSAAVLGIIGAGGLGFQILLSLQSLRYEQVWTLLFALCVLCGLTDFWSSLLRYRQRLPTRFHITQSRDVSDEWRESRAWKATDPIVKLSLLVTLFMIPFSFWYIHADVGRVFSPKSTQLLLDVIQESFPPNFDGGLVTELFQLALKTLAMSILAIAGAGLGAILISFPAANNFLLPGGILDSGHRGRTVWFGAGVLLLARGILLLCRAVPAPVWALLALFVLFPGILPGAIGLGLYTFGVLGRLMAEQIENLDTRPLRALKAQGARGGHVFLYAVLPRTLPGSIAYIFYRWEECLRETLIVGLVGAGGLGLILEEQLSSFDYRSVMTTLLFYIGLIFLIDLTSNSIRHAIR